MARKKEYKQVDFKRMAQYGEAIDITNWSDENLMMLRQNSDLIKVAISSGVNGMNGALLQDLRTGCLYVITSRNSTLFRMV